MLIFLSSDNKIVLMLLSESISNYFIRATRNARIFSFPVRDFTGGGRKDNRARRKGATGPDTKGTARKHREDWEACPGKSHQMKDVRNSYGKHYFVN